MNTADTSSLILILSAGLLLLASISTLLIGHMLPRRGSEFVGAAILVLLGAAFWNWHQFVHTEAVNNSSILFTPVTWLKGWLLERQETNSITVGVLQDPLSLTLVVVAALLGGLLLLSVHLRERFSASTHPRRHRHYTAIGFAVAGASIASFSLTPWLAFTGLSISLLGALFAIDASWQSAPEAAITSRLAWSRAWGLILAILGAILLTSHHQSLLFYPAPSWDAGTLAVRVGAAMLLAGLMLCVQPFPFLAETVSRSRTPLAIRISLTQTFPALAATVVLIRLEPALRAAGIFPQASWLFVAAAFLTLLTGLFQADWRAAFGAWSGAAHALSLSILAVAGPEAALTVLLSTALCSAAFATAADLLDDEKKSPSSPSQWLKAAITLALASITGVVLFSSNLGWMQWLGSSTLSHAHVALAAFVFLFFVILGWKNLWAVRALPYAPNAHWTSITIPFLLVIATLAPIWLGTLTGQALPDNADRLSSPLLNAMLTSANLANAGVWDFTIASAVFWPTLLIGILTSYWTTKDQNDRWLLLATKLPRTVLFMADGYALETFAQKIRNALAWFAGKSELVLNTHFSSRILPEFLGISLRKISIWTVRADALVLHHLTRICGQAINAPAQLIQKIQNGNVQWYLSFMLAATAAILAYLYYLSMGA